MKKVSLIVVLAMAAFGSFIGWGSSGMTGSVTASTPSIAPPIFIEKPTLSALNLNVDLKTGELTADGIGNKTVTVNITKDVETRPVYLTKNIYIEDTKTVEKLLNKFVPLSINKSCIDSSKASSIAQRVERSKPIASITPEEVKRLVQ